MLDTAMARGAKAAAKGRCNARHDSSRHCFAKPNNTRGTVV